jgi:hypothetical protein
MANAHQPNSLTLTAASNLIREKELSSTELLDSLLNRIEETDSAVHAYVRVDAEAARLAAKRADQEIASGAWKGPLHGIPFSLKDVFLTAGVPTEAGSRVMQGFVSGRDSGVGERLKAAGGILLGKTVTHEFAYGQDTPATRRAGVEHQAGRRSGLLFLPNRRNRHSTRGSECARCLGVDGSYHHRRQYPNPRVRHDGNHDYSRG